MEVTAKKVRVIPFPDFLAVTSIGFCYIGPNYLSALIICHLKHAKKSGKGITLTFISRLFNKFASFDR
jgi:hypothetical protein